MNLIKAIVAALFIVSITLAANAQERYEQMTIYYNINTLRLCISSDTGEYKDETAPKSESKGPFDLSPALVRIKKWSEQGWELYQTSAITRIEYVFHLRRPLK